MTDTPYYQILPNPAGYKEFKRLHRYLADPFPPDFRPPPAVMASPQHGYSRRATADNVQGMLTNNVLRLA